QFIKAHTAAYTDETYCQSAMSHEFSHTIQAPFSNIAWSPTWEAISTGTIQVNHHIKEGQATFIQSVYMDGNPTGDGAEFLQNSSYHSAANSYTQSSSINKHINEQSYEFAMFWRFLYENSYKGSTINKLGIIKNCLERLDIQAQSTYSLENEITAFNQALQNTSYTDFNHAYLDFARRCMVNNVADSTWKPCPNNDFYLRPYAPAIYDTQIHNNSTNESFDRSINKPLLMQNIYLSCWSDIDNICIHLSKNTTDTDFGIQAVVASSAGILQENSIIMQDDLEVSVSFAQIPAGSTIYLSVVRLDHETTLSADYTISYNTQNNNVSGTLSGDVLWDKSTYTVTADLELAETATLTINPGTIVRFAAGVKFDVFGNIIFHGTPEAPITFINLVDGQPWAGIRVFDLQTGNTIIKNCTFSGANKSIQNRLSEDILGGAVYCFNSSITFENCLFENNTAVSGGAVAGNSVSNLVYTDCIFRNNTATEFGGAIFAMDHSDQFFLRSLFHDNICLGGGYNGKGGAIYAYSYSDLSVDFCVFTENTAAYHSGAFDLGGALYYELNSNIVMNNSILWNNFPTELGSDWLGDYDINYCNIQNMPSRYSYANVISADPLFVDAESKDFRLSWENYPEDDSTKSPCIDSGNPAFPLDPDGTIVDMGCSAFFQYEVQEQFLPPSDIAISFNDGAVSLSWSDSIRNRQDRAVFYRVYSSDAPDGDFEEDLSGFYDGNTWSASLTENKRFYYIKTVTQ
ncbi:MAG: right-handed parallel beta-helix repeat-containing protein, partial [Candidatus Cloacimonetes bacterium]|nr:right-handed parallel beta-helix repeat-containing protein [Candidatus Cloacimonadota bacterium]